MSRKMFYLSSILIVLSLLLSACAGVTGQPAPAASVADVDKACGLTDGSFVTISGVKYFCPGRQQLAPAAGWNESIGQPTGGPGAGSGYYPTQPAAPCAGCAETPTPTASGTTIDLTAMAGGLTDCKSFEQTVMNAMGVTDKTKVGTQSLPINYTLVNGFHDLCFAWSQFGSGAKWIKITGPAALQVGEGCGPARMIWVPEDTTITECVNGGWRYQTTSAMSAQWKVENFSAGRLGLICGYQKQLKLFIEAFRFTGTTLVRATDLDCEISMSELGLATYTATTVLSDLGSSPYIQFKVLYKGTPYCGVRAMTTSFPTGTTKVEDWTETAHNDTDFLYDAGTYGMSSTNGFCKPSGGKTWVTAYLTTAGSFMEVSFPLE